jgi:hypothetical protein
VSHDASPRERRADRPTHGRSLASDPYGCGKCHYDVGNIIDHAIKAFVSPFTSEVTDLGLNQEPRMTLVLIKSKALRVGETFYKKWAMASLYAGISETGFLRQVHCQFSPLESHNLN